MGIPLGHEYEYELYIYTGLTPNSGTDSKVHLILVGYEGRSEQFLLEDGLRKVNSDSSS